MLLSHTEIAIIGLLIRKPGTFASDLRDKLEAKHSTVYVTLDRMLAQDPPLVTLKKVDDVEFGRERYLYYVTEAGKQAYKDFLSYHEVIAQSEKLNAELDVDSELT